MGFAGRATKATKAARERRQSFQKAKKKKDAKERDEQEDLAREGVVRGEGGSGAGEIGNLIDFANEKDEDLLF